MGTIERRADRGRRRAIQSARSIGSEIRQARLAAGLSLRAASDAVGLSASTLRRIELADIPSVSIRELSLAGAAVGLDIVIRAYPDGDPVRDSSQNNLLERFHRCLPPSAPWRTEVPLPIRGDRRAWDAMTILERVRTAIEAETRLGDLQALERKIELKRRDGRIDIVILVVADTRHNRAVLAAHRESMRGSFPLDGRAVMAALRAGRPPAASGIVVL
jgi:transcriptional regulator with XRE-family HTH domain